MKKEKGHVINKAMPLLRGKEMVFKAFGSGIFSLHTDNYSEQSEW